MIPLRSSSWIYKVESSTPAVLSRSSIKNKKEEKTDTLRLVKMFSETFPPDRFLWILSVNKADDYRCWNQ